MALEQGIDAQVQNKMDAYRSNPQQLMKMYQTNKQLVDLLALQKLKSEKDAAARNIQMQMQQTPSTIKQQREQELMQMTKDELAQQTKGILQQKQRKQQANLQRIAKGKSGLGALAQNRPTPVQTQTPKSMMARGGIVAFQPGGEVNTSPFERGVKSVMDDIGDTTARKKLENQVRTLYGRYGAPIGIFARQSDRSRAQAKDILNRVNSGELSNEQLQMLINQFPTFQSSAKQDIMSGSALNVDEMTGRGLGDFTAPYINKAGDLTMERQYFATPTISSNIESALAGNPDLEGYYNPDAERGNRISVPLNQLELDRAKASDMEKGIIGANRTKPLAALYDTSMITPSTDEISGFNMEAGIAALNVPPSDNVKMKDTAVDTAIADVNNQMAGISAINTGDMSGAENVLTRGVSIGEDVLGRDEKAAKYAELEADLASFDEDMYDPEELRRRQLKAFLIGAAGKSTPGIAMASGAAAALNEESRQKINSRKRLIDRINLSKDAMTSDTDLGKSALTLGNQMFADYNANQRTAMSAAATLGAAKLKAVTDRAKLDFEREREENTQEYRLKDLAIRQADNNIEQARNEQLDLDRRLKGNLTATAKLLDVVQKETENAAKLFGVESATLLLQTFTPDDEGYEAAKAARDTAVAEADAYAAQRLEESGVYDKLSALEKMYFELTGVQNMPEIKVDDITKIEPKR